MIIIRRCRSISAFRYYLTLGGDFTVTEAINNEDGLANALAWHFAAMWVLVLNFLAYLDRRLCLRAFPPRFPAGHAQRLGRAIFSRRCAVGSAIGWANTTPCRRCSTGACSRAILVTILSGLSIWKPVQLKELTWLFGGYEFARVVHFFGMAAIVGFLVVHVALTHAGAEDLGRDGPRPRLGCAASRGRRHGDDPSRSSSASRS